jgi:transposase
MIYVKVIATVFVNQGAKNQAGNTVMKVNLSMNTNPDIYRKNTPNVKNLLATVEVIDSTHRQVVVDILKPLPLYTEHRSYRKICPCCGADNKGVYPEAVKSPIRYGENVKSTVAYMSIYQYVSYNRIVKFFKDMYSLSLSHGNIDNILKEMNDKSKYAYEEIRKRITSSEVVGSDETDYRVNGHKHWFHVWQTQLLTFIVSFANRGYKVLPKSGLSLIDVFTALECLVRCRNI